MMSVAKLSVSARTTPAASVHPAAYLRGLSALKLALLPSSARCDAVGSRLVMSDGVAEHDEAGPVVRMTLTGPDRCLCELQRVRQVFTRSKIRVE